MPNINNEAVDNILKYSRSEKIFLKALSIYKLRKSNIGESVIILLICTILAVTLGINPNIVSLVTNSVSIFLNVSLALFGIIFTGYAIFQTLLSNKLTIHLFEDASIDSNKIVKSKLQETNENFVYLMMLFIFGIIINIILSILLPVIPPDFCLFKNRQLCCIISIFLIDIFLYMMGVILWRMVSFISNIYHLFNAYAVSRLIEALNDETDE